MHMLDMLFLLVLAVFLTRSCVVHSSPTLSELGSDITILIHNDLQGMISLLIFETLVLLNTQLSKIRRRHQKPPQGLGNATSLSDLTSGWGIGMQSAWGAIMVC